MKKKVAKLLLAVVLMVVTVTSGLGMSSVSAKTTRYRSQIVRSGNGSYYYYDRTGSRYNKDYDCKIGSTWYGFTTNGRIIYRLKSYGYSFRCYKANGKNLVKSTWIYWGSRNGSKIWYYVNYTGVVTRQFDTKTGRLSVMSKYYYKQPVKAGYRNVCVGGKEVTKYFYSSSSCYNGIYKLAFNKADGYKNHCYVMKSGTIAKDGVRYGTENGKNRYYVANTNGFCIGKLVGDDKNGWSFSGYKYNPDINKGFYSPSVAGIVTYGVNTFAYVEGGNAAKVKDGVVTVDGKLYKVEDNKPVIVPADVVIEQGDSYLVNIEGSDGTVKCCSVKDYVLVDGKLLFVDRSADSLTVKTAVDGTYYSASSNVLYNVEHGTASIISTGVYYVEETNDIYSVTDGKCIGLTASTSGIVATSNGKEYLVNKGEVKTNAGNYHVGDYMYKVEEDGRVAKETHSGYFYSDSNYYCFDETGKVYNATRVNNTLYFVRDNKKYEMAITAVTTEDDETLCEYVDYTEHECSFKKVTNTIEHETTFSVSPWSSIQYNINIGYSEIVTSYVCDCGTVSGCSSEKVDYNVDALYNWERVVEYKHVSGDIHKAKVVSWTPIEICNTCRDMVGNRHVSILDEDYICDDCGVTAAQYSLAFETVYEDGTVLYALSRNSLYNCTKDCVPTEIPYVISEGATDEKITYDRAVIDGKVVVKNRDVEEIPCTGGCKNKALAQQ